MNELVNETSAIATSSIERDIFQRKMVGVADEMSASLRRSAYSPIIWDMYDYACAVFTAGLEMIAQADTIAAQLGVMSMALAEMNKKIPVSTWKSGDVYISNDPYSGCTHTPDIVLFSPIMANDQLVGIACAIAHHVDIGGKTPCTTAPDNVELFGEGLVFPPLQLVKQGQANEALFSMLAANVRNPQASLGDLRAQIAACRTAEKRIAEIVQLYGTDRFLDLCDQTLDYGESYLKQALTRLEGRRVSASVLLDDHVSSAEPMKVCCEISVDNNQVTVDFTGSSDQRAHAMNCPLSSTYALSIYALKTALAPDIAQNDGFMRPVTIIAPHGSILNPKWPGAVGSRHYTAQAIADVMLKALRDFVTDFGYGSSHISFPAIKAGGLDTRAGAVEEGVDPSYFVVTDLLGGGGGATNTGDGLDAIDTHGGNCSILPAEIMETTCPIRVLRSELVDGSGGAGEFRGGLGIRREYEMLCDGIQVNVYLQQTDKATEAWGTDGGEPGKVARAELIQPGESSGNKPCMKTIELSPKSSGLPANTGAVVRIESGGGGGFGPVKSRSKALLKNDAVQGYCGES